MCSCSAQMTFVGCLRYRAWRATLANRYCNTHKWRMNGCGKFFGIHDFFVDHLWSHTLMVDDNYCRGDRPVSPSAVSTENRRDWNTAGHLFCLQRVPSKRGPPFLHCEEGAVASGWSDAVQIEICDELKHRSNSSGLIQTALSTSTMLSTAPFPWSRWRNCSLGADTWPCLLSMRDRISSKSNKTYKVGKICKRCKVSRHCKKRPSLQDLLQSIAKEHPCRVWMGAL